MRKSPSGVSTTAHGADELRPVRPRWQRLDPGGRGGGVVLRHHRECEDGDRGLSAPSSFFDQALALEATQHFVAVTQVEAPTPSTAQEARMLEGRGLQRFAGLMVAHEKRRREYVAGSGRVGLRPGQGGPRRRG